MKIALLKVFDLATFSLFIPGPAGFTNEETAKRFCKARNAEEKDLFYAYDMVDISEMKPEDL